MRRSYPIVAMLLLLGCSDDGSSNPDAAVPDARLDIGINEGGADQGPVKLPELPVASGVVYVAHYHTTDLRIYRVDGADPTAEPAVELGPGHESHDLALDPYNDRLYVVSDSGKRVALHKLSRPAAAGQALTAPALEATIDTGDRIPLLAQVDPRRHRLYVVASPPGAAVPTSYLLLAYDVSVPASPTPLAGSPFTIPVTSSVALDAPRQLLFVVQAKTHKLYAYDLHGDQLRALDGEPLDLEALYPQQNQTAFQVRSLTVDPWRNRLFAARSQSVLSELIVVEYPNLLPTAAAGYAMLARMSALKAIADPFDADIPSDQRPNLMDAYQPALDLERGHVFLSADAWTGTGAAALVATIGDGMKLAQSCAAHESFGCWYQSYSAGNPGTHLRTDGAACVDHTHRVFVGTSVDEQDETQPGSVVLFRYQPDLSIAPWVPSGGANLTAGGLPVAAVCH